MINIRMYIRIFNIELSFFFFFNVVRTWMIVINFIDASRNCDKTNLSMNPRKVL